MRILVVGAGAIGGYFGGRLLEAGRDVTFLVRPKRAAQLSSGGLHIRSPKGDLAFPHPATVQTDALRGPIDLILLSCKAYDLESAIESFAPVVGPETRILPLLNGMAQLDALDRHFGAGHTLGGLCLISSTLDSEGRILHLNELHGLTFGERAGGRSTRVETVAAVFANAGFDARLSETIMQEMWAKWVFISAAAGITCLMRSSVGDIVAGGGSSLAARLVDECAAVAGKNGFLQIHETIDRIRGMLSASGSPMTASMLRDIEQGGQIEADHIIGDLLARGDILESPLLSIVYVHLKAYEARRARQAAKPSPV
jgi:2-dehydropantoate 2-reductase